jgi:hypothetical protein
MPESCSKIIPPSPILDFSYLEAILRNPWSFLALTTSIEIPRASNLPAEQASQVCIRNG